MNENRKEKMVQTIIPMPMPMPVSHSSGNDDPRVIIATISAIFIFSVLLWIVGWIYKKVTDGDDNLVELFGECATIILICLFIIALITELIFHFI